MTSLIRPLSIITLALVALILLLLMQAGPLVSYFAENLIVNSVILAVLIFGILLSYWRLYSLSFEIEWLGQVKGAGPSSDANKLANAGTIARLPILSAFAVVWRRFFDSNQVLTPALSTSLIESAQARVDERRELSRYIITALIILGLLGTFWGLLGTLRSMQTAFESLGTDAVGKDFVASLTTALETPLKNMATAFSSSLFGLAASLFFGLVELQTARAQNSFVEDFETWLASLVQAGTPLNASAATPQTQRVAPMSAEVGGQIEGLQSLMRRGQQDTMVLNNNLVTLLDQVSRVADKLAADQAIHEKILASQTDISALVGKMDTLTTSLTQAPDANAALIKALQDQTAALSQQLSQSSAAQTKALADLAAKEKQTPEVVAGAFIQPSKDS